MTWFKTEVKDLNTAVCVNALRKFHLKLDCSDKLLFKTRVQLNVRPKFEFGLNFHLTLYYTSRCVSNAAAELYGTKAIVCYTAQMSNATIQSN